MLLESIVIYPDRHKITKKPSFYSVLSYQLWQPRRDTGSRSVTIRSSWLQTRGGCRFERGSQPSRKDQASENFAIMRHIATNLLKQEKNAKLEFRCDCPLKTH